MWESVVLPLVQAGLAALAAALITRLFRRVWRWRRVLRTTERIVSDVDEELEGLIRRGEAEFSGLARTKRALAVARLRDEFPHLAERELDELVADALRRAAARRAPPR